MNNLTTQHTARLAVLRILTLLFEDAAESVPMDPQEYLADMYCLWRSMTVATLPVAESEEESEQEESVRQQLAAIEERLLIMMRSYGLEAAYLDTERAELIARSVGHRHR